ncbi:fatty acid-binding protein, liver-like [Anthonomus grandis grandis]|uniref:fatty acid-binding protein, liver-like n=1 Tax=Anthonomus grandis grandis TaxID=2921223 RepID=UPI002165D498|nr:fatty acid-binding protein, liver-like [Anthonomus grandis grandis]
MVQLEGTYQFVSEQGYKDYLKTFGAADEAVEKLAASTEPVVISSVTSDSITINYGTNDHVLPLGKQTEISLSAGRSVKVTPTVSGDTITMNSVFGTKPEITEEKILKVTDSGLTATSTNSKGGKAVRNYTRA